MSNTELPAKYDQLKKYIASFGKVAVAFSSGVDSTFLLYAAKDALGSDKVLAVTAVSEVFPGREKTESEDFCKAQGIRQIQVHTSELEIDGFAQNPKDRCYLCKKEIFGRMKACAQENGCAVLLEGSNMDDNGDYRPGMIAIAELDIKSPLRAVGFWKSEIREMSRGLGLPTWEKPSFACLASRFPYGEQITKEKLAMVDKGEQLLLGLGFRQFRVRIHGNVARIELLPEDFPRMMEEGVRLKIYAEFQKYGFSYVALDLKGYRTGSMNETLKSL